jgi:hypothetical protein
LRRANFKRAIAVCTASLLILLTVAPLAQAASYEEIRLVKLINGYRTSKGLSELVLLDRLSDAAHAHSADMAANNYFSHDSQNGAKFSDRIAAAGYTTNTSLGENIAAGMWKAADVFTAWKQSPGHNSIMLSKGYKAIGVSRVFSPESDYEWYWTADFGGVVDSSKKVAQASESGNWANDYIQWLIKRKAASGYPDGTFRPDNPVTRAKFSAMIVKALAVPVNGSKMFTDTKRHWAKAYISTLANRGYLNGYGDGSFRPDSLITRAEMVKVISKAGALKASAGKQTFSDISGHWAKSYIETASSNNIISGYPNGKFRPDAICLRADTAASIYRLLNN